MFRLGNSTEQEVDWWLLRARCKEVGLGKEGETAHRYRVSAGGFENVPKLILVMVVQPWGYNKKPLNCIL